jgi:HPt (histidine-containing phosphotransfer) domain-containing protein
MDTSILTNNGVDINRGLELLGDMEFYNETLTQFLDEIDNNKARLLEYKNNNDFENYGILSHSIKSDSKYLGFVSLIDIALANEMAGKESNKEFIQNNFGAFIAEINKFEEIGKRYLGR